MAILTTKQRKKMPKGEFAIPSKAPGSGSYPINDPGHARNALSRVSQFGTPSEKAQVRSAVHSKYPDMGEQGEGYRKRMKRMTKRRS